VEGRGEKGQEKKTGIQLSLAVSFIFVFYPGHFCNRLFLFEIVEGSTVDLVIYKGLGFVIIILAITSFFPLVS